MEGWWLAWGGGGLRQRLFVLKLTEGGRFEAESNKPPEHLIAG